MAERFTFPVTRPASYGASTPFSGARGGLTALFSLPINFAPNLIQTNNIGAGIALSIAVAGDVSLNIPTSFGLNSVLNNKVYQRSKGQTSGPVALSGTFGGGTITNIEAQVLKRSDNSIVKDWTNLTGVSASLGSWTGTLAGVPQGTDQYYIKARPTNATGLVQTDSNSFFMGAVFVCYGQSNMNGFFATQQATVPTPSAGTVTWDGTNNVWTTAAQGNGITQFLNDMRSTLGIAVGAINGAINGTNISFLADTQSPNVNSPQGGGLWRYFNNIMAPAGVTDAEMWLWDQGEGDAGVGTTLSSYEGSFTTMQTAMCAQFGRTTAQLPCMVEGLTTYGGGDQSDANWQSMRSTLFHLGTGDLANVTFSHSMMDGSRVDVYHLGGASNQLAGKRFARTAKYLYGLGGAPAHFEITGGATVDATHTNMTVTLTGGATDITPTTGITGFEVSGDNGATWSTATGARVDATTVQLTHSSIATDSNRKVRYQYGQLPDVSSPLRDNSTLALPATFTPAFISPTPLSSSVVPQYQGNFTLANPSSDNVTWTLSGNALPSTRGSRTVLFAVLQNMGGYDAVTYQTSPTQVVVTPNVGTAKTAVIVEGRNGGSPREETSAFYQVQFDADADTATSFTFTATFAANPFGAAPIHYWTMSGNMASVTPVAHHYASSGRAGGDTSVTATIKTVAGGSFVGVAKTANTSASHLPTASSGSGESIATRASGTSPFDFVVFDAAGVAANSANSVTATWDPADATSVNQWVDMILVSMDAAGSGAAVKVPQPVRGGSYRAGTTTTLTSSAISIGAAAPQRMVIVPVRAPNSTNSGSLVSSIVVTPNVGSAKTVSSGSFDFVGSNIVVGHVVLGSDADTATTATVTVNYSSDQGGAGSAVEVWYCNSGDLNSATPLDTKTHNFTGTPTTGTISNLNTSKDGFVLALAYSQDANLAAIDFTSTVTTYAPQRVAFDQFEFATTALAYPISGGVAANSFDTTWTLATAGGGGNSYFEMALISWR